MASPRSWRNLTATLAILVPVVAFVVYSSFRVSSVECKVCMRFDGRESCRTASAADREEALRAAVDNACALLTSGMTNSIRCQRAEPVTVECRPAAGGDAPTRGAKTERSG
jgi:hypothetical protein